MAAHNTAFKWLLKAGLLLAVIGFTLLALGVLSPAWVSNLGRGNNTVEEGIWFSRICYAQGGPCIVSNRNWILKHYGTVKRHEVYETLDWSEFRALTAISLIGSLLTMSTLVASLYKSEKQYGIPILVVGGLMSLVSCICVLVTVLKISVSSQTNRWDKVWSRLVATVGCIVQFVATILTVFAASQICMRTIKTKLRQNENSGHENSGREHSGREDSGRENSGRNHSNRRHSDVPTDIGIHADVLQCRVMASTCLDANSLRSSRLSVHASTVDSSVCTPTRKVNTFSDYQPAPPNYLESPPLNTDISGSVIMAQSR